LPQHFASRLCISMSTMSRSPSPISASTSPFPALLNSSLAFSPSLANHVSPSSNRAAGVFPATLHVRTQELKQLEPRPRGLGCGFR